MASKFGGSEAAKNHWVMQQNMAKHKSVKAYVPKPPRPPKKVAPKPVETTDKPEQT